MQKFDTVTSLLETFEDITLWSEGISSILSTKSKGKGGKQQKSEDNEIDRVTKRLRGAGSFER